MGAAYCIIRALTGSTYEDEETEDMVDAQNAAGHVKRPFSSRADAAFAVPWNSCSGENPRLLYP